MNNCSDYSIKGRCGEWTDPTVDDKGACFPYREKRTCEAPSLPVVQCADDQYIVIPQPNDPVNPFKISARLFDQNCLPITDQTGANILTYIV